ncbi:MAG: hypothetical protein N2654_06420 [Deltaproteobacteria bacterium]|nr:hypothetical protein [Deltaproteobacteria bacterium]
MFKEAFIFSLALVSSIFAYLRKAQFHVDADEGVTGLMATHIFEGSSLPVFYYGQNYIGPMEALLAAFLFNFIEDRVVALKLAATIFSVLAYLLGYITLAKYFCKTSAIIFSIIFCFPGQFMLEWFSMARGNFSYTLFAAFVTTLFVARMNEKMSIFLGLFHGFSWWQNGQLTSIALAYTTLFFKNKAITHYLAGFIIGMLPVIWFNLINDFGTLEQLGKKNYDIPLNVENFFTLFLPTLLGFVRTYHQSGFAMFLAGAIFFATFSSLFIKNTYDAQKRIIHFNVLNQIMFFTIFVISSFGSSKIEPRYGMALLPSVAILTSIVVANIRTTLIVVFIFLLIVPRTKSFFIEAQFKPSGTKLIGHKARIPRDLQGLVSALKNKEIYSVRTPYWLAYNLAYVSQETVRVHLVREPFVSRYVYFKHADLRDIPVLDHENFKDYYKRIAQITGSDFFEDEVTATIKLYRVVPSVSNFNYNFRLKGDWNEVDLAKLTDGDLMTYWHTNKTFSSGILFFAEINGCFKGISVCTSRYFQDIPEKLELNINEKKIPIPDEWVNYLKSSGCLDFLLPQNFYDTSLKLYGYTGIDKKFFPSFSEFRVISCE